MNIKQVILRHMKMRMRRPFTTSVGTEYDKEFILVEAKSEDGLSGWGESVAAIEPFYKEETVKMNWHMLEDFLLPLVFEKPIEHPDELTNERFAHIRGNYMAKAAIEGAVWDLYARQKGMTLAQALGGEKKKIEVGISLGIEDSVDELLRLVEKYVYEGYKRIKVKIQPGWDVEVIRAVRERFPDIKLMADANSAYTLDDAEHLRKLDAFNLTMIEQPLAHDDIVDHAELQAQLRTPICLDESIYSVEDVRKAIKLKSCGVINIKIGRVGGLTEAKKIHDICKEHNIPVWCGGMLEAGVGRAHNVAITTLSNFIMPGDTAASARYWEKDIIIPEVTVKDGWITVPEGPGIGYEVSRERLDEFTLYSKSYLA
ncbi:o-succinylbenzoate synthase [Aneurinibacillus aneurinilyticus]|jgi:O-succinylbenzoate synthase|uniref:o-succinylbenzoate synthase n=1 Tax=Aneurinibacillus aneurinilyticus TaxID=1391 RepID=UPI0023F72593|nr:o-succinylbenzoate synthase [Aneurinibacillus aneurinilyticus]MCI1695612.1 o-succinylbenzoate synthase [Aneurinibacillus aneurinilyticus]